MILLNQSRNRSRVHPQLFGLWLAMASIIMMFGAFTSAYLVKHATASWEGFAMPQIFFLSTIIILLSSISLHISYKSFVSGNEKMYKLLLVVSLVLGVGFVISQYLGWQMLYDNGIYLNGNASNGFFYIITGVHVAHVLGGIAAFIVALIHAFSLPYHVTEGRKHRFQLTLHYWHFVDILWVYLFVFLLLGR